MEGYLGEFDVELSETPFADYCTTDWVQYFIWNFNIDGYHHKQALIDQILRITFNAPIIVKQARWECGYREYRVSLGEPDNEYFTLTDTDDDDEF